MYRETLAAELGIQDTFDDTNDRFREARKVSGKKESRNWSRKEAMAVMVDAPIWSFRQLGAGRKSWKTAAVKSSPATLGRKRLGY